MRKEIDKILSASLACLGVFTATMPVMASTSDYTYRKKVIGLTGIMSNVNTEMNSEVSRGEFARMLVKASTYRDVLADASNVSVYADVSSDYPYASAIRIAAEQDWMTGYLGGLFKPDQSVTLKEAVRGILALLGYMNEDFTGDLTNSRMALYASLELNDEVNRQENEVLTRTDCVNLFYNLLVTEMKDSNTVYGTVIGCEVTADGEIDPMDMADTSLVGPKLVRKGRNLGNYVPFNVQEASIFINGEASSYSMARNVISDDYVVLYYNQQAKTIWIYTTDDETEESGRCAIRGEITNIVYQSADVMTPSAVILDEDEDKTLYLDSSSMQFAFSIYGSLQVGDTVTVVCEKSVNSNGDVTYTVVDYVED